MKGIHDCESLYCVNLVLFGTVVDCDCVVWSPFLLTGFIGNSIRVWVKIWRTKKKGLTQERSTLKSKVKTAAIGFESCLRRNEQDLEYQFQAVQHSFNDFTSCHLSYEEAANANDSFETYKTVNGLNLDDYYNVVSSQTYAWQCFRIVCEVLGWETRKTFDVVFK